MSGAATRERTGSLLTRRLKLRPFRPRDTAVLSRLSTSDAIRQNVTLALSGDGAARVAEMFVVERVADRTPIGAGGFALVDRSDCAVELALWIAEADWGCGYGTEATQALIDRAFAGASVREVWAAIRVTNARGRQLVEKCGFQTRGTGMARRSPESGAFPVERFVLARRAWASIKAWGAAMEKEGEGDGPRQSAA